MSRSAALTERQKMLYWCRYLKGVMQVGQEEVVLGENPGRKGSPLMPRAGREASSQAEIQASETFVRLLCQFEPEAVLAFLQSHEAYRVQVRKASLRTSSP